jgi:uncharacterized protein
MLYNVAGLLKASTGATREVEVDADIDLGDEEVACVSPVRGAVRLIRDHAGILVQGTLATAVQMACARCLGPVVLGLEVELEEEYRPTASIPGGPRPVGRDDWEAATQIDERNHMDLTEVVRQSILVAVPLHPLCRADCAGLCPRCGADRNAGPCDCAPEPDPRWEGLRALLEQA